MLTHLLFESPVWIIFLLLIAAAVAGWRYYQTRGRPALVAMGVLSGLSVLLGIVAALVETDREQIEASWDRLDQAVRARDSDGALAEVSVEFRSGGLTRGHLELLAAQAVKRLDDARVSFYLFAVQEIDDSPASPASPAATATVWSQYMPSQGVSAEGGRQGFPSQWRIRYRKDADGRWRISGAESIQPANINLGWALRQ